MSPRVCLKILSSSFVIPGCAFLEWGPRPAYNYKFNNDPESRRLTALPTQSRLFKTVSIALPASRFLREHLRQIDLIWACTSRIHAQVPIITTGQLAKTLRQQIPCGIDIAVVVGPASRACPLPLIQPQHIECVLAHRASLARGIPTIHLDQNPTVPVTFVGELPANLAERSVL